MSDEPKVKAKPSRHSRRQRIVRQVRRAARAENYSDVLKYYLDLCLYEMEGNNTLAEKMTPRTIVEIVEARIALKKLEVYEATLKQDGDTTLDEFKHRLDHISKHKMDDVKLKLVKKG
tara:strand:+ start:872 stop:1225 length:354 start_codon:yes stop_codon:yes gene_type:complete